MQTEQLIDSLVQGAGAVKPVAGPVSLCKKWLLAASAYMFIMAQFLSLRADISEKLFSPLFLAEVLSLIAIIATTSYSAMLLSFPDAYQKRRLLAAPLISGAVFTLVIFLAWHADSPPAPQPSHEFACLSCISFLSFLPGFVLFWHMRKMASTSRGLAGCMAALSAFGIGALTLRLSEDTDSISHLVQWHYLPMLGVCILGALLGKLVLKW